MATTDSTRRRIDAKKPSREGKLSVAEPTTFRKFFILLLMHICKKILFVDTAVKAGIYTIVIAVGSVLTDVLPPPKMYLASKTNIFNIFFVGFGWGWTCGLLCLFIYLTTNIYCLRDKRLVQRHFMRMFIGTVIWFVCTTFFNYVENATGSCTEGGYYDKISCRNAGGTWIGFDISGHGFLLVYCLLLISEEVKCLKGWPKIKDIIQKEEENPSGKFSSEKLEKLKTDLEESTGYIQGATVALTVLTLLWEVMLASTMLYFHNMPQKLAGVTFAVFMWFSTYKVLFRTVHSLPWPGKGHLRYNFEL